jgi:hypothetical protein
MNRCQTLILTTSFLFSFVATSSAQDSRVSIENHDATPVATALNHLTVLEFSEPVTLAAAGGTDFQIERLDNKVFVKPLKSGSSTNLFVWTASHRFSYELEPAGEVRNMNFAIDNTISEAKPADVPQIHVEQLADLMLTRAFLGAEQVDSSRITISKNRVTLRIEQVFRTKSTLYIHYLIENHSNDSYTVSPSNAYELLVGRCPISLPALQGHQLDQQTVRKLRNTKEVILPIGHAEAKPEEISPGETSNGVIAIRRHLNSPTVLQLVFNGGVKAVVVL